MKFLLSGIAMFLFTANILNKEVVDFEIDVTYIENYETDCQIYAEKAASSESVTYGGEYGYTYEEYYNAYWDYLYYCDEVLGSNNFGGTPSQPVFVQ